MADKFTAEWYEEQANKYKLRTWTPSERFPELGKGGRLDLILLKLMHIKVKKLNEKCAIIIL